MHADRRLHRLRCWLIVIRLSALTLTSRDSAACADALILKRSAAHTVYNSGRIRRMLNFEDTKNIVDTVRLDSKKSERRIFLLCENSRLKFESSYWNEEVAHDEA